MMLIKGLVLELSSSLLKCTRNVVGEDVSWYSGLDDSSFDRHNHKPGRLNLFMKW